MGKKVKLSELSNAELIDQLKRCWQHFRACALALDGKHSEPVTLFSCDELGDCDDLELFYKCKKVSELVDKVYESLNANSENDVAGEK